MNHTKALVLFTLLGAAAFAGCSGVPAGPCTVNCTPTGNATLSVTLQSKPLALTPAPNTNILTYSLTVAGLSLTPASGNPINIPGPLTFDMMRLQSDSGLLGTVTVPSGTYASLTLSFTDAVVTSCTSTAGVAGCNTASVIQNKGGVAAPVITFPNGGLVITSNQQAGVSVVFDMGGTLTVANQVVSAVNLANSNLTAITPGLHAPVGPHRLATRLSRRPHRQRHRQRQQRHHQDRQSRHHYRGRRLQHLLFAELQYSRHRRRHQHHQLRAVQPNRQHRRHPQRRRHHQTDCLRSVPHRILRRQQGLDRRRRSFHAHLRLAI